MAAANTYNTTSPGSGSLNREDLSDTLTRLEPQATPLFSLCGKGKAKATTLEWGVDKLAAVNTDGVSEGEDVASFVNKAADRARLSTFVQKTWRPWQVTDFQESVDSAGIASDIADAETKALLECKRDVEAIIASSNDKQQEAGTGSPYKTRGLGDWIDSAGPSDVPSAYRTPAGSIKTGGATLDEATLDDLLTSVFSKTGTVSRSTLVCGTALRQAISNFSRTGVAATGVQYSVTEAAASKKVTLQVKVFDGNHGLVNIVDGNPDCMASANDGFLVHEGSMKWKSLKAIGSKRLEDQGGGPRGIVDCIGGLCISHPQKFGKIST
jgi:hypothetical protein